MGSSGVAKEWESLHGYGAYLRETRRLGVEG